MPFATARSGGKLVDQHYLFAFGLLSRTQFNSSLHDPPRRSRPLSLWPNMVSLPSPSSLRPMFPSFPENHILSTPYNSSHFLNPFIQCPHLCAELFKRQILYPHSYQALQHKLDRHREILSLPPQMAIAGDILVDKRDTQPGLVATWQTAGKHQNDYTSAPLLCLHLLHLLRWL